MALNISPKILNILSFIFLILSALAYGFVRQGIIPAYWVVVLLLGAILARFLFYKARLNEVEKENEELKKDLKNLTQILKEKTTNEK